jgi:two-component system chemotaxis response regulator CheB
MDEQGLLRYRCRVGHGYTSTALSVHQETLLDEALWAALRALEESASLARRMASRARERNHHHSAQRYDERARGSESQAELIRQVLHNGGLKPNGNGHAQDGDTLPASK